MTGGRIVVLGRIPEPGLTRLAEAGEVWAWDRDEPIPTEIRDARLADADAAVTLLTNQVDEAFLAAAPKLKIVANVAVGYNNIDLDACAPPRRARVEHPGGARRRHGRPGDGADVDGDAPAGRG